MTKPHCIALVGVTIAAAAGCAPRTPYSTAVPVLPVAEGVPAPIVRYDLHVNRSSAGTVTVSAGTAEREARHQHVVRLTVGVDNRTSDRRFVLPLGEVMLRNPEGGAVWPAAQLIEVDRQPVPPTVAVEPGRARAVSLAFAMPRGTRVSDLDRATLAWTLVIEDPTAGEQPVRFARATALITDESGRVYGAPPPGAEQNVTYAPSGMLPAQLPRGPRAPAAAATEGTPRGNQALRRTKERPQL